MSQAVVTRFAPSPTGNLHVGGARTALYNWAYARRHGGRFILRLEDTDQARSSTASAKAIIRDLAWLGIKWDEGPKQDASDPLDSAEHEGPSGPYCQSKRLHLYNKQIENLLTSGRAYEDDGAVRMKMGDTAGDITIDDQVLGPVTIKATELEDFVIRKQDGFPTFHLAVVVDDETMGVNHVIRGKEHLSNTPKHMALQTALGFAHPTYAHIPLIFNPDGSKMSKRDKAKVARAAAKERYPEPVALAAFLDKLLEDFNTTVSVIAMDDRREEPIDRELISKFLNNKNNDVDVARLIAAELNIQLPEIEVDDFRSTGHLPDALCNYLTLLGWNPGGDLENFNNAFLAENFGFEGVGKSDAKFDRKKLASFNQDAIAEMNATAFRHALHKFDFNVFTKEDFFDSREDPRFAAFAEAYQPRSQTFADPARLGAFFFAADDDIDYDADPKSLKKVMNKNEGAGYKALHELLSKFESLPAESFGKAVHDLITQMAAMKEVKLGVYAQPIRFAISGSTVTPPIDATLDILGKAATVHRVSRCLELRKPPA